MSQASNSLRRRLLQIVGLTALNWGLAGQVAGAQTVKAKEPELLRIGYQKSAVNLVILKQQGVLEKRFPNTKISWIEFPAGPQLLEALSVGSLASPATHPLCSPRPLARTCSMLAPSRPSPTAQPSWCSRIRR